uniref:Alpha-1,3-mannosyl-glycoprotein 2-beta-N-acetylglucosaminyltransferase n=1 Tax=Acrobeloides nanus TaxID=290746 RepID=A0A914DP34_9BILA
MILGLFTLVLILINSSPEIDGYSEQIDPLYKEVRRLEQIVDTEHDKIVEVDKKIENYIRAKRVRLERSHFSPEVHKNLTEVVQAWQEPIVTLVLVCNRVDAIRNHLLKLLKYRPSSEQFPIVVSQDCDNEDVANEVRKYEPYVKYIKHISGEKANLNIPANNQRYTAYYRIARHYKLALTHVFETLHYNSVIITEDDLDVSPDFFDYFRGTRWLLEKDPTLYCVSAWNDNGKPSLIDKNAHDLLYRSDFFPGLGWMLTSKLWEEMGPIWPEGFWDDWIRDPARRKNRSCIRPEISRTAMTLYGKKGASKGLFFNNHLIKIITNDVPVNFTKLNLNYLLKDQYDGPFLDKIYSIQQLTIDELIKETLKKRESSTSFRVQYSSMHEYTNIARRLNIMIDTKAGVPRTAYHGIVTCFINNVRIYVAPSSRDGWTGYDKNWEPPSDSIAKK